MKSPDVNVLIYSHRDDSREHAYFADWLVKLANGREPYAVSVLALSGFVRVVTSPRAMVRPTRLEQALDFCDRLVSRPQARVIGPGPDHWQIVATLCRATGATGKLVADAQHAAIAIEHGCTWVSTDADFARFPGLRWEHPLRPTRA